MRSPHRFAPPSAASLCIRALAALAVGVVTLVAGGCVSSSSSVAAGSTVPRRVASRSGVITSTLDDRATLPRRIIWQATPSIPTTRVREVDFLIDGRLAWVEHSAPYIYGGDDNGTDRGYLVTTWLSPGRHAFTARAVDMSGRAVSKTVTASVRRAPAPPAGLRGVWTRTVTARDIAKAGVVDGPPPSGRWELAFDRVAAWELDPLREGLADEVSARRGRLTVSVPIVSAPFANGHSTTTAYGHHDLGGTDCTPAGPVGRYHWSRAGNKLTLTVIHEGCPNREAIWAGTWTRVSPQPRANFKP